MVATSGLEGCRCPQRKPQPDRRLFLCGAGRMSMDRELDSPIVAIGASAGGVQALQTFFDLMPNDTGATFVVIVHLDPHARSELANILAARTRMPVTQVEDQARLESNHVYVIAPNRRLKIAD